MVKVVNVKRVSPSRVPPTATPAGLDTALEEEIKKEVERATGLFAPQPWGIYVARKNYYFIAFKSGYIYAPKYPPTHRHTIAWAVKFQLR